MDMTSDLKIANPEEKIKSMETFFSWWGYKCQYWIVAWLLSLYPLRNCIGTVYCI
jgi:hypothetical protein